MTEEDIDDLVEKWHTNPADQRSLEDFICDHTGWNHFDFEYWVITGKMP